MSDRQDLSIHPREHNATNIGTAERVVSVIAGGAMLAYALKRRAITGALLAGGGALLVRRGATGHCEVYQTVGMNTVRRSAGMPAVRHNRGIRVEKTVTINRTPQELYRFWRDVENLPRFMEHLKSVVQIDRSRSHWIARGPAGMSVAWDAEIYNEQEDEMIAWRSLENSDVNHAGSVHFRRAPGNRGTEVRVELSYEPPVGKMLGEVMSRVMTEEPERQVEKDLHRFKQLMETGEIPTTEGQPSGRLRSVPDRMLALT